MRRTWHWALLVTCLSLACDHPVPSSPPLLAETSLAAIAPGNVTDLAVTGTTDTSATIAFSEVANGDGGAASYDIRFARSPISWGSAPSVTRGTCASPLAGTAVGSRRTCVIAGLLAGNRYDIQLVPFRGTLNLNASFGPLSNVASATIAVAVASVSVTPAAPVDTVGRSIQFKASALDIAGNVLAGRTLNWTSSDTAVIKVDAAGLGRAVGAGTATVSASTGGKTGSAVARIVVARPGTVNDLAMVGTTDSSLNVAFTEVSSGAGTPASYDIRVSTSTAGWGSATSVARGSCATPVAGGTVGARRECSIRGLTPSTTYTVQLVAFRGVLNAGAVYGALSNIVSGATTARVPAPTPPTAAECGSPRPEWLWCDDFEQDRIARYFEYDAAGGNFARAAAVGYGGSSGMRVRWIAGAVSTGGLHLAIGRTPSTYFRPVDAGTANYREVYWRLYVKHQAGWVGGAGVKLSRAFIFANSNWAQAAIAHIWGGVGTGPDQNILIADPASGTSTSGTLITTQYNDFANLRWLGAARTTTPIFDAAHVGQWYCIEAHMRLNTAGSSNGVFEIWVDGRPEVARTGLNWVGAYSQYGINAVYFENYWNGGAVASQERYMDNIVVSTSRIGCM